MDRAAFVRAWSEYLPPTPRDARAVEDEAEEKARAGAARVSLLPQPELAEALAEPAEEQARALVLLRAGSPPGMHLFQEPLLRARDPLAARGASPTAEAVLGVLAAVGVVLSIGGYVKGHYDGTTRDGLELEVRWLEGIAAQGTGSPKTRKTLALAALAHGRPELAARLDPRSPLPAAFADRERLGDALVALVGGFFEAEDLGWTDLLFAARTFVVHVEGRGAGGIGAAARWLHDLVRNGPDARVAPAPPAEPPPPDAARVERANRLFVAGAGAPWTAIEVWSVHGLWGGFALFATAQGQVWVEDVARGQYGRRFKAQLTIAGLAELDRLVRDLALEELRLPPRTPVADETYVSFTCSHGGRVTTVLKWDAQPHAALDALAAWTKDATTTLAATRKPDSAGTWDGSWRPGGGPRF